MLTSAIKGFVLRSFVLPLSVNGVAKTRPYLKVMFAFSCMPKISGSSNCGSKLKLSEHLQSDDSIPILAAVG